MGYLRRSKMRPFIVLLVFTVIVIITYVFDSQKSSDHSIEGVAEIVTDGDTIVISSLTGEKNVTCRLYGIDAPEVATNSQHGQPYGDKAREELKGLVYKQKIKVTLTGKKSYQRDICIVEKDKMNINLEMIKRGFAWAYKEYLERPYASEFLEAESKARAKKLGLWQQVNPQPPWEFRKLVRVR